MLAYVFWHRARDDADPAAYEQAQRSFHASLQTPSASFRLEELPFANGGGYEDWYLVEDWAELGELNRAAVDSGRRTDHDRVASLAADGWGAVYGLARGPLAILDAVEWLDKPRATPYVEFIDSLPETTVWQRQMVLGPGPEFCVAALSPGTAIRERIWPVT